MIYGFKKIDGVTWQGAHCLWLSELRLNQLEKNESVINGNPEQADKLFDLVINSNEIGLKQM